MAKSPNVCSAHTKYGLPPVKGWKLLGEEALRRFVGDVGEVAQELSFAHERAPETYRYGEDQHARGDGGRQHVFDDVLCPERTSLRFS